MKGKLFANRYADYSPGGSNPNETFTDIADLGMRWALPGGLQRLELTIRARSSIDAWRRFKDHLGHTIAVYDNMIDRYIGAQVYEIVPDGRHVTYICAGWWYRTFDDIYQMTDMSTSGDTDDVIQDILTDSVAIDSGDYSNIDASGVAAIPGWTVDEQHSKTAAEAIAELAAVGNSSDLPMDFYYVDPGFVNGVQMQSPDPYLKARSNTASFDWIFSAADLVQDGLTLSRNIWDLLSGGIVRYGRKSGTADAGSGSGVLVDAAGAFVSGKVRPGDTFVNLSELEQHEIESVDSATQLTMTDTSAAISTNDIYAILLREPVTGSTRSGTTNYWSIIREFNKQELDATTAAQWMDTYLDIYEDAVQRTAFVIGAPTIRGGNGNRYPLWRPFMGDSFYFRMEDLFPEVAVFTSSGDRRQTFMAASMDYTYSDNRLRIVPTTSDMRLDVILNQAGLIRGQIIATQETARNRKRQGQRYTDNNGAWV